jgi:hypothetical protein
MPIQLCHCGCVARDGSVYTWLIAPPIPPAPADGHWLNCHPDSYYEALEESAPE